MSVLSKNFSYLLFVTILVLSGCSGGSSSGSSNPPADNDDPVDDDGGDSGSGDGSSGNTSYSTPSSTVNGVVVDGYIRNAFVCVDINRDNECDDGEPYTKADGAGTYSVDISELIASQIASAQIIAQGGTDNDTGKLYTGILKAPLFTDSEGTINLSPLNTLLATQLALENESLSESVVNSYKDKLQEQLGLAEGSDVQADPKKNANIYDASIQVQEGVEMYAEALRVGLSSLGELAAFDSAMEALANELLGSSHDGSSTAAISTASVEASSDSVGSNDAIANIFAGIESVTIDGTTIELPAELREDLVSAVEEIGTELANAETNSEESLVLSLLVAMVDTIKEAIAASDDLNYVVLDDSNTNVTIPEDESELDKLEVERLFDLIGATSEELGDNYDSYITEVKNLDKEKQIVGDTSVDSFADLIDAWIINDNTTESQLAMLDTLQAYINSTLIETSSEYLPVSEVVAGGVYLLDSKYEEGILLSSYNQLGYLNIVLRGDMFEEDPSNPGTGQFIESEIVFNPEGEGSFATLSTHTDLSAENTGSNYVLSTDKGWVSLAMEEHIGGGEYRSQIYYTTSSDDQILTLSYKDLEGNYYPYVEAVFQALEVAGESRIFDLVDTTYSGVLDELKLEAISHTFNSGHELIIDAIFDPAIILSDHYDGGSLNSRTDEGGSTPDLESYLSNCNGTLDRLALDGITNLDALFQGCAPLKTSYSVSSSQSGIITDLDYIVVFDNFDATSKSGDIFSFSISDSEVSHSQIGTYEVESLSSSNSSIQFTNIDWWKTSAEYEDEWFINNFVASDGISTRLAYNLGDRYDSSDDHDYYYDGVAVDELLQANIDEFDGLFEDDSTTIELDFVSAKLTQNDCQVPNEIYMHIDGLSETVFNDDDYVTYNFSTMNGEIMEVDYDSNTGSLSLSNSASSYQATVYLLKDILAPSTYYASLYGYDEDWNYVNTDSVVLASSGSNNSAQLQLSDGTFEFWCE